jgi:hypothetical protein
MGQKFIRVYQEQDVSEISQHLLVYGDLSASCENCKAIDLKLDMKQCPSCQTEFKYISFRNVKSHYPKMKKIMGERPGVLIIDFDDYKKCIGAIKAENFLK